MTEHDRLPPFNGLSIQKIELAQDGEMEVTFDLPVEQTTYKWRADLVGSRTFNVYDDPELLDIVKQLFLRLRAKFEEPDEYSASVHCDRCATSDCCRLYNVLVMEDDCERLAAHLGLELSDFKEKHTSKAVDWSEDYPYQLRSDVDGEGREKCVFLKADVSGQFRCSVYNHRPSICRAFDMRTCQDFVPLSEVKSFSGSQKA